MKTPKKFASLFLCFILIASLISCMETNHDELEQEDNDLTGTFIEVDRGISWHVVYHRDSKVMYVVGGGTFTLLVNADGSPMLWSEKN